MPTVLPGPNASAPGSAGYGNYSGANSGFGTLSPPPSATPTPSIPATRPANNSPGSQGRISQQAPSQRGTQSRPDVARKNPPGLFSTNAPGGGTVTSEETDSAALTFDQRLAKTLRRIIIGFYLLIWLIFLLWLLFAWWRRWHRKKMQRVDGL
jgi:hypothetical protein